MTRINIVPVEELCDQHLFAEWRELTRIPNGIISGKLKIVIEDIPKEYTVRTQDRPEGGKGHMKFFYNKMEFLYNRYRSILKELEERDIPQNNNWKYSNKDTTFKNFWNDYVPSEKEMNLNRKRILERMPKSPRYGKEKL